MIDDDDDPVTGTTASLRARVVVRLIGAAALAMLVALPLILSGGCRATPEQRYRILSFFFDGVPPPGGGVAMLNDDTAGSGGPQTSRNQPTAPVTLSIHAPYQRRECSKCHGSTGTFRVSVSDIAACDTCHTDYGDTGPDKWVHGAMSLGCATCHVPHKSEYEALLKRPQMETCMDCHQVAPVLDRPYHATAKSGEDRCGKCHDPHKAGNRLLLVDADTYRHRQLKNQQPVSIHPPFMNHECQTCHVVEELNRVRDNIDAICQSCHANVVEQAPPTAHKAVRDGKCVACHNPHDSARPHLVRVTAQEMCYACHKPEETQTPQHPSATQSDCLLCHQGHHSDFPKLLRPPIAQTVMPGPIAPPATQPAAATQPLAAPPAMPAPLNPVDRLPAGAAS